MNSQPNVLFSEIVECGIKHYRIETKISRNGNKYIVIRDDDKSPSEAFDNSVVVFPQYASRFMFALEDAVDAMRKKADTPAVKSTRQRRSVVAIPNEGTPWTPEDDAQLKIKYQNGESVSSIARYFERKFGAIRLRLNHLGLKRHR